MLGAALIVATVLGSAGPTVLVLNSYHRGFTWTDQETDGFLARMRERYPTIDPFVEHLDRKRFGVPEPGGPLWRFLEEKYRGQHLDGIVATDDAAFDFAMEHRARLFGDAPLAFCGVNEFTDARIAGRRRVTGVVEEVDLRGTLAFIRSLQPDVAEVVLALDETETSRAIAAQAGATAGALGVELQVEDALTLDELAALAARQPPRTAVLLGSFVRDRLGRAYTYEEVAERVSGASRAPVYGLWEFQLGHGIVGGSLLSGNAQGRRAADLLLDLLDGRGEVPVDRGAAAVLFLDERAARRFALDAGRVAANPALVTINHQSTLWEDHRGTVLATAAVVLALAALSTTSLLGNRRLRRARQALRESNQRFRDLAGLLPQPVFETDAAGRVTFLNRKAFEVLGYLESDLASGLRAADCLVEQRDARGDTSLGRRLRRGEPVDGVEGLIRRRDGSTLPGLIYVSPILDEGRRAGWRGLVVDLTDRKRVEAERTQLQARLGRLERLESIGRLAGGIAHDFNNLLTPIVGLADAVRARLAPESPDAADLSAVVDAARRAAELTSQILAFTRQRPLELRPMDVNEVLREVRALLGRVLGEDVELRLSPGSDLGLVRGDPARLHQVLMNLAVNARDAMPCGGVLAISSRAVHLTEEEALARGLPSGDCVELLVADDGLGMDAEVRRHLFEPFFTTKGPGKGTGLGLATVHAVVQQHGGAIDVESEPGRGTRFRILLPRLASGEPARAPLATVRATGRRGTVLVVEDEQAVREVVVRFLEAGGFTVLAARDGREALALAAERSDPIDLLVTDVVMPGLSGPEVAAELARRRPSLRTLFVSGYPALPGGAADLVVAGRDQLLAKPFTADELLARVDEVLGGR